MTFPALVHNWLGRSTGEVAPSVDPPSSASLCFVAAGQQAGQSNVAPRNNVIRMTACASPDGQYALICGNLGVSATTPDFGYYYTSDHGANWTYTQWKDVTTVHTLGDSSVVAGNSGGQKPVSIVWEPINERFVMVWEDGGNDTQFWWMRPATSMTTWARFLESQIAITKLRSWVCIPKGNGDLFIGAMGAGIARLFTTQGPSWENAINVQVDSTSTFVRDIFTDVDDIGVDFNVLYHGYRFGGIYQLWVQAYGGGPPDNANGLRWLRWNGSDTINVVSKPNWLLGYAGSGFSYGDSPDRAFMYKLGTRTMMEITAGMPVTGTAPSSEFSLPTHPAHGGQICAVGYSPTAGWVVCGVPDSAVSWTVPPSSTVAYDKILVWRSVSGAPGTWSSPFVMDIPFINYGPPLGPVSYINATDSLLIRSALIYLGGPGTPNKWALIAPRGSSTSQGPMAAYCFNASAGGIELIDLGAIPYTDEDLWWIQRGPDLLWSLDDLGQPTSVRDYGTKSYINTTNAADSSDITFGATAPYAGTAAKFLNSAAKISTASVTVTDHWIFAVADVTDRSGDTVVLQLDFIYAQTIPLQIVLGASGWFARIAAPSGNIDSAPIAYVSDKAEILIRYRNRTARGGAGNGAASVETYSIASVDPDDEIEFPTTFNLVPFFDSGRFEVKGENIVVDHVAILPGFRATAEEILNQYGPASPPTLAAPLAPGAGETLCIVNAESPSGLDIGNDVAGALSNDVVALDASNIGTTDAKFGTNHLEIPARTTLQPRFPYTQPVWQRSSLLLEPGLRDLTVECWWKTLAASKFGYLGGNFGIMPFGPRFYRYGGMAIAVADDGGGAARMTLYIGPSQTEAYTRRNNDLATGTAVTAQIRWNSGYTGGAYNHFALSRKDGTWRFFLNGRQPDSIVYRDSADAYIHRSNEPWRFGTIMYPHTNDTQVAALSYACRIDAFRYILGTAIYQQNFDAPTTAPS